MPTRLVPLANDEYYHVFNRGVARQPVFKGKRDYERFLLTLSYYRRSKPAIKLSHFLTLPQDMRTKMVQQKSNSKPHIEIVSFVLMPNHFHLLLRQKVDGGISTFLRWTLNSYTRFFNTKYDRVGPIFQGAFKAVHVETEEQLLHLSRYIHLNPLTNFLIREQDLLSYPWSSLSEFLSGKHVLVAPKAILSAFTSVEQYKQFILDRIDYAKTLESIKHLSLD